MKRKLDMERIARGLGARRGGKVAAAGGYFGAMQLLADEKTAADLSEADAESLIRPKSKRPPKRKLSIRAK